MWRLGSALFAWVAAPSASGAQRVPDAPAGQNPSPMAESTRRHERLAPTALPGVTRTIGGPAGRAIEVYVPDGARRSNTFDLVMHFHGSAFVPHGAGARSGRDAVVAVVNLGAGSGVYHRAFVEPSTLDSLLAGISAEVSKIAGRTMRSGRLVLSGFSAGHGAIRAILLDPRHFARVDAIVLMDGMHTSYVPEGRVLADSGTLDTTNLAAFARFAKAAVRGEKQFVVTHSEIFPGTFASTTETADWLLQSLGLRRTPVLRWGPRGMQQLSEAKAGRFELLGFAGNSAPDHIDHFHAMPELLRQVLRRPVRGGRH